MPSDEETPRTLNERTWKEDELGLSQTGTNFCQWEKHELREGLLSHSLRILQKRLKSNEKNDL